MTVFYAVLVVIYFIFSHLISKWLSVQIYPLFIEDKKLEKGKTLSDIYDGAFFEK